MEPAKAPTQTALLFNPNTFDPSDLDDESRRILRATIDFFESRGKAELKRADHEREWYSDFLEFVNRERVFSTLLTPAAEAGGDPEKRWDTTRICALQRDHGLLRSGVLVHVAGLDPRARPDLAERQHGGEAARGRGCSTTARSSPSACPSASTAPTSTRPTCCSPRQMTGASRRAAASTTSATATRPGWSRSSAGVPTSTAPTATSSSPPTASTPTTSWSRTSSTPRCT